MDCANSSNMITHWMIKDGDIPNWFLVEVLIRLSRKSIFRFKLVSKTWLSTILEPSFVRAYCSRAMSLSPYQPWTILTSRTYTAGQGSKKKPQFDSETDDIVCNKFLDYDMLEGISKSSSFHPLSLPNCERPLFDHTTDEEESVSYGGVKRYDIYGVSNGLVLFRYSYAYYVPESSLQILNPATGQRLSLPPHKPKYDPTNLGFHAVVEDGVLLSFIVGFLYEYKEKNLKSLVYFSQTDEWKKFNVHIDKPTPIKWLIDPNESTVLNGIIHWIDSCNNVMIAYDPETNPNRARIIALPGDSFKDRDKHKDHCSAYHGKLRYCRLKYHELEEHSWELSYISIWVMNDYSLGDWCLQHHVNYDDIRLSEVLSGRDLIPIAFHPYDSDIVYFQYQYGEIYTNEFKVKVNTYNMKTKKSNKESSIDHVKGGYDSFLLMIPPWPISRCHPSIRGWDDGDLTAEDYDD